jgi:hypothetical protein
MDRWYLKEDRRKVAYPRCFTCREYLAAMVNPLAETYLNEANKLDGSNFIN